MIRHSIRFQLTICFALALTTIMLVSAVFWERNLSRVMMKNVDDHLLLIANEIESLHLHEHQFYGNDVTICERMGELALSQNWDVYIQVLTPQGATTCASKNLGDWRFPLADADLGALARGVPHLTLSSKPDRPRVRLLTYGVRDQARLVDIVQVGKDLSPYEVGLKGLRNQMLLYSPLLIAGVSLCGWMLAGRALQPVDRMTAKIRKITADRLNERLPLDQHANELTELTVTFNAMLERLADSFQRIRQFTGDASHELRTPLAILKGETEVALRWARGEDELRAALASNLEEINRMERITEDLLSLAKSESKEFHLTPATFSLNDLLQDLYLIGNTLGANKRIQVTLALNVDREIYITADQMHLHRALLNLVTNAVKYTPDDGTVELALDLDADQTAIISVRDSGIGIAAEHLPHLFERFYRVDEARNRSIGGTGLGLALVKAIVDAHHGTVAVTSVPGQGSNFVLHLPLSGPTEV